MSLPGARAAAVLLCLGLVGCAAGARTDASDQPLTVYAAASLGEALDAAAAAYEAQVAGVRLTISTGSSAALEAQIEQGAPADLFLSADTANPRKLADAGLADGRPLAFAGNALVVIVPAGNPARIASPADLARPGVKIVAAGEAVPISSYAGRLIERLATQPGYPHDFAAAYRTNVVSREDDVEAIVAKIALDEADAGIVYRTDASASTGVRSVELPDDANVLATYAGVVIKGSPQADAAAALLAWLSGEQGQAVLAGFGFEGPPA